MQKAGMAGSLGQSFSMGLQSVNVCAVARVAKVAAAANEVKRILKMCRFALGKVAV